MSVTTARATGTTVNAYATAATLDSYPTDYRYLAVRLEETSGSGSGVTWKVQGTLNDEDWDDLILLDETGSDHSAVEIAVPSSNTDQAFIAGPASARSGVNAVYGRYRVLVKSTTTDQPSDYQIDVIAKE